MAQKFPCGIVWAAVALRAFGPCMTCIPWYGLRAKDDPFHEAVMDNDFDKVRQMLKAGHSPDAPGLNPKAGTALYGAVAFGDFKMAELLVSYGADVNHVQWGRSLLYHMAREDNRAGYEWLLEQGANPDPTATARWTRVPNNLRGPSYSQEL